MKPAKDFTKFAEKLLTRAAKFDQADLDNSTDDDSLRIEVLRDFTQKHLKHQISDAAAIRINELTRHPDERESYDLAPILSGLLRA